MKNIITIDTGTTNTRVVLWQHGDVTAMAKQPVGVRDTAITGSKTKLKQAIKLCIDSVLAEQQITSTENIIAVASGMITSNLGLVEIPHLTAPVGLSDLADGMQSVTIPDV